MVTLFRYRLLRNPTILLIGDLLQQKWLQQLVMVGGIAYDLTIIPILYWARTRKFGVAVSVVFHLFNSIVFGIGIFPYLMLSSLVLFFPVRSLRSKIPGYQVQLQEQKQVQAQVQEQDQSQLPKRTQTLYFILAVYFLWQLWLPVRHYFIPGDVFITEEGHRMAWRMMLRTKYGWASFRLVNKETGENWVVNPKEYLTEKQSLKMAGRPDMIWQFTRYLARIYAQKGIDQLEIYINTNVYLNGSRIVPFIDPNTDLLSVDWNRFGHNEWIVGMANFEHGE